MTRSAVTGHIQVSFKPRDAARVLEAWIGGGTETATAVWVLVIERIGVPGQLELLAGSIGPATAAADLARLAGLLEAGDDRVAAAVGAMVAGDHA